MSPSEKAEIKTIVESELATLERSIITLTELLESEVQSDANDWFSSKESNASKEINEMALEKARMRIISLNDVLNRINSPEFGLCSNCGDPIPLARIKAVPTATRCISCSGS